MVKPYAISKLGITPLIGKKLKSPKEKAVFDHIVHTGHNASFEEFSVMNLDFSSDSHF